jgi:hypothetical protein
MNSTSIAAEGQTRAARPCVESWEIDRVRRRRSSGEEEEEEEEEERAAGSG